ncbi:MAG: TonB-dependent receptor [Acidobacteriota bacterium]|nr:TonB-dependent receptor [Acidobacteriota bacterium]
MVSTLSRLWAVGCVLLSAALFPAVAWQESGHIAGVATDRDGKPLAHVEVTVQGKFLFKERTAFTDDQGRFRVPNIPPAENYRITFRKPGFKTMVRDDIQVHLGQTSRLTAALPLNTVNEVIAVTGKDMPAEFSKESQGLNMSGQALHTVPGTRDPWTILEITPGVFMSQVNIGGNKQGKQSRMGVHGTSPYQNTYTMDGVNLTDNSAGGASSIYYDYETFNAIKVSTASHDASIGAPGISIIMAGKTGSNKFEGKLGYSYSGDQFQSDNSLTVEGRELSATQDAVQSWFVNFRGPLIKDKLWFFAAHHQNRIDLFVPNTQETVLDQANLEQTNANLKWAVHRDHTLKIAYNESNKTQSNRLPGWPSRTYYQGAGKGWNQRSPSESWYIHDEWFVNESLTLNLKYSQGDFPFDLGVPADAPPDVLTRYPVHIDRSTGTATSAYLFSEFGRDTRALSVRGNFYRNAGIASHEINFGFEDQTSRDFRDDVYPGDAIVQKFNANDGEVWFYRATRTGTKTESRSLYVSDVMTVGRFTYNFGLRYQDQAGSIDQGILKPSWQQVPENLGFRDGATFAERFASGESAALNNVVRWRDLVPRFSMTFDPAGDGRTLVKLGLNQYANSLNTDQFTMASTTFEYEEDYPWRDMDGNGLWLGDGTDWDEVDFDNQLWASTQTTGTPIADDYRAPKTDEAILKLSRQFRNNLTMSAAVIHRKAYNFTYTRQLGAAGLENWQEGSFQDANGVTRRVFNYVGDGLTGTLRTNLDDFEVDYTGFELTLNKRGKGYNLHMSVTRGGTHYDYDPDELNDPNNAENLSRDIRFTNDYAGDWTAKLFGSYTLPHKIQLSGKMRYESGRYFNPYQLYFNGLNSSTLLTEGRNNDHMPSYALIDLGLAKNFRLNGRGNLEMRLDMFNLTNENAVTAYSTANVEGISYRRPAEILGPRVARLSMTYIY